MADIHTGDDTYRITTSTAIDGLKDAIEHVGLVHRPILNQYHQNKWRIVSGFRRIAAYAALGRKTIPARVISPATASVDTIHATCVQMAIVDNALNRELNIIEQSRAAVLFDGLGEGKKALKQSALGLPVNQNQWNMLLKIGRLSAGLQDLILNGRISPAVALSLMELGDTGLVFAGLFQSLNMSLNKQRECITQVREIACRENEAMTDILKATPVTDILSNTDLTTNQKTDAVRSYFQKRRFPEISKTESRFAAIVKDLGLDPHTRLIPPKHFEGLFYTLSFSFKTLPDLAKRQHILSKILQHDDFKGLMFLKA